MGELIQFVCYNTKLKQKKWEREKTFTLVQLLVSGSGQFRPRLFGMPHKMDGYQFQYDRTDGLVFSDIS